MMFIKYERVISMKFKFYRNEGKIYDHLMLPTLIGVSEEEISKVNEVFASEDPGEIMDSDHIGFVKEAREALQDFKDPLLGFYADETLSNYDFPTILMHVYSIIGFDDYKAYLAHILNEDELTLKRNLIYSLVTLGETDIDKQKDMWLERSEKLLNDSEKLLETVRNLPTTDNFRWTLLMLIENPKRYLEMYRDFLISIEPLFDRYHKRHKQEIDTFIKEHYEDLEQNREEAFERRTRGIVPLDILKDENKVITSFVHPYSFMIQSSGDDRLILWGLRMDTGFSKVASFQKERRHHLTKVFKTLSDKTRYEVLRQIAAGNTSTKRIASELGVSSATVTYHINAFLTADILKISSSKDLRFEIDYARLKAFWDEFMEDLRQD